MWDPDEELAPFLLTVSLVNGEPDRLDVHLHLPSATIVKVLLTVLIVWAGLRLWPEFIFLTLSLLLAVALHPLSLQLEKRGLSRGMAVLLIGLVMVAVSSALLWVMFTSLAEQAGRLVQDFPAFRQRIMEQIPASYGILKKVVGQLFALPYSPQFASQARAALAWGTSALSGVVGTFFILVLTLYLLLDGKRLYAWLLAYVPRRHREKMAVTVEGVSQVVTVYVRGQMIASALFMSFTAIVLSAFQVPAALPLALLAGFCDVIPVVGIVIAAVPAVLLAMAVSPVVAAAVAGLYIIYHVVEVYIIVPRVYGQRLRLSTLAVLLALVAGTTLQGLLGAVLVLPLVAAYPIIERIWLANYLSPEVIRDHKALARAAETGSERAVEAVLQGEKHPGEGPAATVVAANGNGNGDGNGKRRGGGRIKPMAGGEKDG
jgi:predicted PurR-regulated permease PerM